MSPGLALFRPEGGPEDVGLAHGHRRRLAVELAALGEKRLPQVEVRHLEERGGSFAGRRREDGRIDEGESTLVEVVPDGLDERVPHRQDRALPGAAQPQVPLLLEEADAVLLRLDGVAGLALQHAKVRSVKLVADGRAGILRHLAAHLDRRFLRRVLGGGEGGFGNVFLGDDALDDPGAVAELQEMELAAGPLPVQPASQHDLFALVRGDVPDVDVGLHRAAHSSGARWGRATLFA